MRRSCSRPAAAQLSPLYASSQAQQLWAAQQHHPMSLLIAPALSVSAAAGQQWFSDRLGRLHPYSTPARCLTLPSSTTTNGQGLTVTDCVNTAPTPSNQRWTPSMAIFPAVFNPQNNRLQSALAAAPQCIDNLAYNTTNGAAVVMMPCNNNATASTNQRWSLTDAGQLQLMFNRAKCMTAVGTGVNGE